MIISLRRIKEEVAKEVAAGNDKGSEFIMEFVKPVEKTGLVTVNGVKLVNITSIRAGYTDNIQGGYGQLTFHADDKMVAKIAIFGRTQDWVELVPNKYEPETRVDIVLHKGPDSNEVKLKWTTAEWQADVKSGATMLDYFQWVEQKKREAQA